MNPEIIMGLSIAGLIVFSIVVRYVIKSVFNKAGDIIQNKLADKNSKKSDNHEENLSDRYK